MRSVLVALAVLAALAGGVRAAEIRFPDDAALRAVQFVDGNEGWSVGDDGVILHSIDGGKSWERQATAVYAALQGIHFLTPFTGWVVGREELPRGGGSVGVVLVTHDGGLKWQRLATNALPGLHCVRFFDDKNGIVAGDASDLFPTGLFQTADGGRSWKPVPGPRCPGWRGADFQSIQTGALAGAWRRLGTVRQGAFGAADADVDTLGGRSILGIQVAGSRAAAVGEGGLVLLSATTAGVRWGFADLHLPAEVQCCLDFHAVACRGDHTWVAGRPGSVILHSADKGQTWEVQRTGQNVPIHGLCFLDTQTGWAVGDLGTVLFTRDGGKSWEAQRQGGQRAALLCIHARPTSVPLDAISLLGGDEGYLAAAVVVTGADTTSAPLTRSADPQRAAAAMRRAAGAAAETLWQFPVPEHLAQAGKEEILKSWDRLHGGKAADQLLRQLVFAIRMWQPDVVVIDPPGQTPLDDLVGEAARLACEKAGDQAVFPEQIAQLGLAPSHVIKVYARSQDPKNSPVVLDLMDVKPRLQSFARDYAAAASALLQETTPSLPNVAAFRLQAAWIKGAENQHNLMDGVDLALGGRARRALPANPPEKDPDLIQALHARRTLERLVETPSGLTEPDRLLAEIGPLLKNLPDDQGAPAVLAVANQFAQAGQWNLARETYLLMVDQYPAHRLSADAYRWLIRHNSSSEARRRHELGQFLIMSQMTVRQGPHNNNVDAPIQGGPEGVGKGQLAILGNLVEARRWYEGCLSVEPRLEAFGGLFGQDPSIQFCLSAAKRSVGKFDEAKEWYTWFLKDHPEGPWHDAAAAELWLVNRQGPPPKPAAICRHASARPFLDGKFDDECWQGVKPLKLRNAVGKTLREKAPGTVDETTPQEYGTEAWFAYDKDFLYLAVRCQTPADRYVPPATRRRRDEDLKAYDRVSILLDLDRDYSTCFHLEIDQRGCIYEDCWGDKSWNPRWFVAVRSEPTCWQVEAAIPLIELTGEALTAGRAWACNVSRILPGRGVQAWSLPADVEPRPEGMGLMLFLQEQQRAATAEAPTPRPASAMPPAKP